MSKRFAVAVIMAFAVLLAIMPVSAQGEPVHYYGAGWWYSQTNFDYLANGVQGENNIVNNNVVDWCIFEFCNVELRNWWLYDTMPWWVQAGFYDAVRTINPYLPSTNNVPTWYIEWRLPLPDVVTYGASTHGSALGYQREKVMIDGYYDHWYKKTWYTRVSKWTGSSWSLVASKTMVTKRGSVLACVSAQSECLSELAPPQNQLSGSYSNLQYKIGEGVGQTFYPWDALIAYADPPYGVSISGPNAFTTFGP